MSPIILDEYSFDSCISQISSLILGQLVLWAGRKSFLHACGTASGKGVSQDYNRALLFGSLQQGCIVSRYATGTTRGEALCDRIPDSSPLAALLHRIYSGREL